MCWIFPFWNECPHETCHWLLLLLLLLLSLLLPVLLSHSHSLASSLSHSLSLFLSILLSFYFLMNRNFSELTLAQSLVKFHSLFVLSGFAVRDGFLFWNSSTPLENQHELVDCSLHKHNIEAFGALHPNYLLMVSWALYVVAYHLN